MKKRLLIVDDAAEVREFVSKVLGSGFEIVFACDGEEALAKIRQERPDIVLLDLWMPGIGGMKTLEQIKAIDSSIPVMVMTAVDDPETAKRTFELGARDYIAKPIDIRYLETTVMAQAVGLCA